MAVVIDDGIAQDAIEPCDGGLVAAEGRSLLHRADVGGLDDVLGRGAGAYSSFYELEELSSLVEETCNSGSHRAPLVGRAVWMVSAPLCWVSCRLGSCSLRRRGRAEDRCRLIRRGKSHSYSLDSPFLSAIPRPNTDADG